MKQGIFTVVDSCGIAEHIYRLRLAGDTGAVTAPGQFVNILIDGCYLRRPISVCDCEDGVLTLIYKVVGIGTEKMSRLKPGMTLDLLTGLGNGYRTDCAGDMPLLVGGGVGVPPLYLLAKKLRAENRSVTAVLGFNKESEIFYDDAFAALGVRVILATADGSRGVRGFVTDAMAMADLNYSYFYACGPEPMLKAVYRASKSAGQLSFEERMGCGFGACMGCSCKTVTGYKRICKDGPVLDKEEILWQNET